MNQEISQLVKDSIRDNQKLLTTFGNERPVRLTRHPEEENILLSLLDLLPKSTGGKLALAGLVAFVAWDYVQEIKNK